jgi:hypothetical protein
VSAPPAPSFSASLPADPFTSFTPGGANLSSGGSSSAPITPGVYGNFNVSGLNTVYLTAGTYYFNSAYFPAYVDLLNISASSPINIFIQGSTGLAGTTVYVNGQDLSTTTSPLSSDVLIDTHGNFSFTGFDDLTGTVFAPDGNITNTGVTYVDGSVIAAGSVSVSDRLNVNYVPSSVVLPEPASLGLLAGLLLISTPRQTATKQARTPKPAR